MAEINNPVFVRLVSEDIRPMAEQARNLLVQAQAAAPGLAAMVAGLGEADDADIIQDNRLGEGVAPITAGQVRACVGVLADLVTQINADPRLGAILGACVRSARVVSG